MITHHSPRSVHAARARRRGVLLLVVLILLVLFVMMAVTYVLVATRQLSTSKAYARKDSTGDPPPQQLDGVAMQLLRGSTNQHSVLYPHSLLEHMYGPYTAVGAISSTVNSVARNSILEFNANLSPADPNFTLSSSLLGYDGYLEGCVITMTSGQAKGLTSRIVRYDATASPPVYHVLAFQGTAGAIVPLKGDTFLINGRAFSGTGFGFNPVDGILDAKDGDSAFPLAGKEFALLPNPLFFNPMQFGSKSNYYNSGAGIPFGGIGGGNTDYDAPDYQHMFMSWTVMNSATGQAQTILPSFHRPDLINYWTQRIRSQATFQSTPQWTDWSSKTYYGNYSDPITGGKLTDSQYMLERIMLRPNPIDHPNFTGSNNYLSAANFASNIAWNPSLGTPCPWDVDNDGDGVADSVWIDAGYPVQAAADGKLYKPLFAILCVDLDGRLNMNAAGTTEQPTRIDTATGQLQKITGPFAGGNSQLVLPRGEGLGPAEDDLFQFYVEMLEENNSSLSTTQLTTDALQAEGYLMQGGNINSVKYDGRYGDSTTSNPSGPQAGTPGSPTLLGEVMRFQYPRNSFDPTTGNIFPLSSFDSPSDLWGRMAVGLDFRGQPLFWKPAWTNETKNDPYDMNLSVGGSYQAYGSQSADNPFGAYDLERLLRQYDVDSAELPRRLFDLSGAGPVTANPTAYGFTSAQAQAMILAMGHTMTTDSWDPPSPGVVAPTYLRDQLGTVYGRKFATSIVELLTARLLKENPSMTPAQINLNIRQLLSPELIAGLRMNINRPLGDGRDSDGNGVVDEATTSEVQKEGLSSSANKWSWLSTVLTNAGFPAPPALDLVNGQNVTGPDSGGVFQVGMEDQVLARQLLARHLYVLARLMIDDNALQSVPWFSNDPSVTGNPVLIKELAIRRIAQWAVNVVDFMDPDNIMTPFEYDVNPFTNDDPAGHAGRTWEVNGILDDASSPIPDDTSAWRRLVWGCEQQSLLISEVLALHDRRVADTSQDSGHKSKVTDTVNKDPDLDQVRIPQGSLFVELYAAHNPNNPTASGDLYTRQGNTWYLNLGAMAPAGNDGASASAQYPVWRLAISKPHQAGASPPAGSTSPSPRTFADPAQGKGNATPSSASFETEQYVGDPNATGSLLPSSMSSSLGINTKVLVDRYVWFASQNPSAASVIDADRIFYAWQYNNPYVASQAYVPPGGYVVVGPRDETSIGSANTSYPPNAALTPPQAWGYPSPEKISLSKMAALGAGVSEVDPAVVDYPDGTQIRAPVTIVAAANRPSSWPATSAPNGIGVNVSEPLPNDSTSPYYTQPTNDNLAITNPLLNQHDAYDNLASPTGTFLDVPFEKLPTANPPPALPNAPVSLLPSGPQTGTTMNYRTVFLQRLANPLAPYHPITNPYLTVDWMPVDLTVFNGEDNLPANTDPDDANSDGAKQNTLAFSSRQRGQFSTNGQPAPKGNTNYNLLSQWPDPTILTTPPPNLFNLGGEDPQYNGGPDASLTTVNFRFNLNNTTTVSNVATKPSVGNASFGFLNQSYGVPLAASDLTGLSGNNLQGVPYSQAYIGDPKSPFPWLTWSNRPYANIAELMMVPATHPGRLLFEFSLADVSDNPYNAELKPGPSGHLAPFSHLLNFFNSSIDPTIGVNLSQMFEYLQVPSPFVGTQEVLNPQTFAWTRGAVGEPSSSPAGVEPAGTAGLHPPFNMVSNYRDPGKVNINTITGGLDSTGTLRSYVWNAIVGGNPTVLGNTAIGPAFNSVALSRQGYGSNPYTFDASHPSIFSNPFRSAAGADMVPIRNTELSVGLEHNPANVTLFRAGTNLAMGSDQLLDVLSPGHPYTPDDTGSNNAPLMMNSSDFAVPPQTQPTAFNHGARNPYFYYQALNHLTSKLTTRSNVYAVWITVGYFEVTPWYGVGVGGTPNTAGPQVFDTAHPDGYQLGQELGSDTGQVERHRAFYIIDRSIPVGFQRGYDNNANKAVLLKRFIE